MNAKCNDINNNGFIFKNTRRKDRSRKDDRPRSPRSQKRNRDEGRSTGGKRHVKEICKLVSKGVDKVETKRRTHTAIPKTQNDRKKQ